MSSNRGVFQIYTAAVDALTTYFSGRSETLVGRESPSEYSVSDVVQFTNGWQTSLVSLLVKLRSATFKCTLTLRAGLYQWEFQVLISTSELMLAPRPATEPEGATPPPDQVVPAHDAFHAAVDKAISSGENLIIDHLLRFIDEVAEKDGSGPKLTLSASLSKDEVEPGTEISARVVYYLFAKNLVADLQSMTLDRLESDFCVAQSRTVIVVFDASISLAGEYLAILGRDQEDEFTKQALSALSGESLKRAASTLEFRKSESLGDFHTEWLTPEFFALNWDPKANNDAVTDLLRQVQALQGLLSALFLADFVDQSTAAIRVEFRGIGVAKFPVDRVDLIKAECVFDPMYRLYLYAYEGFSTDKLEIVQQFLSLMANSGLTLCSKSIDVKEAARKTYAVVLRDKVSVYFDALNKIQERIKLATDKAAESAINLSRDVSNDLYKIAGVLAAVIAGALLKPDLGWPVGLAASLVIGAYLTLIIYYHLATLTRGYSLGFDQHTDYVNSFEPLLGERVEEFLNDENLKRARDLFLDRVGAAEQLYAIFLVLSLVIAQTSAHELWTR